MSEIWSWIRSLAIALVFALLITIFVFQPYKVEGHSMEPTLQDQQRIYVSKLPHTFSYLPDYGDVVVIDSRTNRERTFVDEVSETPLIQLVTGVEGHFLYVKRVIGKPGDVLEFKNHKVYRNGTALDEPYIKEAMDYVADGKWVVPENHVFVMGDNRNNSKDSRDIGFIPLDHVLGTKIDFSL
ncbi:signal peptidase I [Brevibacillus humidisoli]|nr:signal peptidase I [Brevibacillus humidisoli]UFJ43385.1 signal peptidase I [Brevibacillus humidisoli]